MIGHARTLGTLALSLGLLVPASARAQSVDAKKTAAAQALYDQATSEMDAKHYATACPKLEEVTRLIPEGLGAKLTLGECYESQGRLASAWVQYSLVGAIAVKVGQSERSQRAAAKAAELKPKLATLSLDVSEATRSAPGLAITRDGLPVGEEQWAKPAPVDAGGHDIVATATGREPWKYHVEVTDGAKLSVRVKAFEPAPEPKAAPVATPAPVMSSSPPSSWQRPAGVAAMGLGVVGVVIGATLGGLAIGKNGESNRDNHCDANDSCDPEGLSLRSKALGLGNGSTGAMIVGGVLLAGGVVLFATAKKVPTQGMGQARARLEVGMSGIQVRGAW
jgi:hypothetical protein